MEPCTVQFGVWAPDLQNVAVQIPAVPGPIPVPCADCLNVYYQDGAYRCLPAPRSFGPSLGAQALNAFTWYDQTSGDELVFAATANGISQLLSGAWSSIPVINVLSVSINGQSLKVTVGANPLLSSQNISLSQGAIGVHSDQIINATMVAGSPVNPDKTGYIASTYGSLTPSTDYNGNLVRVINNDSGFPRLTLEIDAASLGQSYFTLLEITGFGTYASSSATYSTSGGTSTWVWTGSGTGFTPGNSYPVVLTI